MPRKVRELIRLIEDDGWSQVTQSGSHRQFKHPTKPGRVTIAGRPGRTVIMASYVVLIEPGPTR